MGERRPRLQRSTPSRLGCDKKVKQPLWTIWVVLPSVELGWAATLWQQENYGSVLASTDDHPLAIAEPGSDVQVGVLHALKSWDAVGIDDLQALDLWCPGIEDCIEEGAQDVLATLRAEDLLEGKICLGG
jgi:hypothetical protein